ncbi:hypothetical protein A8W25_02435 [Streptomyces sp. ERV7]|uniref:hypothetical protein n=1 Tax=Streptomyces sp. ERV7 TaxID=1322334 RepID=UPI0007F50973|nr:hypothetical protein [Streptomyces sp. ERV7]OAR27148.1 hypothetical protein A8W25_02435 [Streptomyces sp. ERV7]
MQHNLKSVARRLTVLVPVLLAALVAVSGPVLSADHSGGTARTSLADTPGHGKDHEEFNTKA